MTLCNLQRKWDHLPTRRLARLLLLDISQGANFEDKRVFWREDPSISKVQPASPLRERRGFLTPSEGRKGGRWRARPPSTTKQCEPRTAARVLLKAEGRWGGRALGRAPRGRLAGPRATRLQGRLPSRVSMLGVWGLGQPALAGSSSGSARPPACKKVAWIARRPHRA